MPSLGSLRTLSTLLQGGRADIINSESLAEKGDILQCAVRHTKLIIQYYNFGCFVRNRRASHPFKLFEMPGGQQRTMYVEVFLKCERNRLLILSNHPEKWIAQLKVSKPNDIAQKMLVFQRRNNLRCSQLIFWTPLKPWINSSQGHSAICEFPWDPIFLDKFLLFI